ncbi:hypothetical protein [Methanosarcina sp.]|uniref:hypothetical protein n=1 Tax=Methanosarcina sp. TaxID=2213 RepID=UPI003C7595E5
MDINFPDSSTALTVGGLSFIFFSFINIASYQDGRISFEVPAGKRKYLFCVGILIIIAGFLLPTNNSEQRYNDAPLVTITNDVTQNINSDQRSDIPTTSDNDDNRTRNYNTNDKEFMIRNKSPFVT